MDVLELLNLTNLQGYIVPRLHLYASVRARSPIVGRCQGAGLY
jgi:hypothetical protein